MLILYTAFITVSFYKVPEKQFINKIYTYIYILCNRYALKQLNGVPLHAECHGPSVPDPGVGAHLTAAHHLHQAVP